MSCLGEAGEAPRPGEPTPPPLASKLLGLIRGIRGIGPWQMATDGNGTGWIFPTGAGKLKFVIEAANTGTNGDWSTTKVSVLETVAFIFYPDKWDSYHVLGVETSDQNSVRPIMLVRQWL